MAQLNVITNKTSESGSSTIKGKSVSKLIRSAKFQIGQIVRHRVYDFRGVIFDVDPEFDNSDEWYESIPEEVRPIKNQPFYHLFAENEETEYEAYVSEQNLVEDLSTEPLRHPEINKVFVLQADGLYKARENFQH